MEPKTQFLLNSGPAPTPPPPTTHQGLERRTTGREVTGGGHQASPTSPCQPPAAGMKTPEKEEVAKPPSPSPAVRSAL